MKIRNTFIIFLVSGFWHGANWTFIVWGFLNALYIMPSIILNTNRNNLDIVAKGKYFPTIREFFAMFTTFSLTTFAWIFFRADNLNRAFSYISTLFSPSLFTRPNQVYFSEEILILTGLFFIVEWFGREQQYAIAAMCSAWKQPFRWAIYILIIMMICLYGGHDQTFIYFQF